MTCNPDRGFEMMQANKQRTIGWAIASATLWLSVGYAAAEVAIGNPNDEINKHFAVASALFDNGTEGFVQLHARQEGTGGDRHKVYAFNCKKQLYNEIYDASAPPEKFPVNSETSPAKSLEKTSSVAPLAAHACKEHGYPLLEMEW